MLTNKIVIKFKPIWKLKEVPTRFIRYIVMAPNNELAKSFNMNFSGTMKILHSINKIHIPDK